MEFQRSKFRDLVLEMKFRSYCEETILNFISSPPLVAEYLLFLLGVVRPCCWARMTPGPGDTAGSGVTMGRGLGTHLAPPIEF